MKGKEIGKKIKLARIDRELTIKDVQNKCAIGANSIVNIEKGEIRIFDKLQDYCRFLNLEIIVQDANK